VGVIVSMVIVQSLPTNLFTSPGARFAAILITATLAVPLALPTFLEIPLSLSLLAAGFSLRAATIAVPNYSFETPTTAFASPSIDSWQQLPNPGSFTSGVFTNAPGSGFIDNCDGTQAAFLIASPQAGIFQDYDSTDYANTTPTHAFNARFEVGKSYHLAAAITGSTNSPLSNGSTLQVALYYRDVASNMVNVASTNISYDSSLFSGVHFLDFQTALGTVQPGDPWAGQHIGISIFSTVSVALEGGAWDIDNVWLLSISPPVLLSPGFSGGHFGFTLQSELGLRFEILASTDASQAISNWTSLGKITNVIGTVPFSDAGPNFDRRFYRAVQTP